MTHIDVIDVILYSFGYTSKCHLVFEYIHINILIIYPNNTVSYLAIDYFGKFLFAYFVFYLLLLLFFSGAESYSADAAVM